MSQALILQMFIEHLLYASIVLGNRDEAVNNRDETNKTLYTDWPQFPYLENGALNQKLLEVPLD